MKTLLQIVQTFCQVTGLASPATVISNSDDQVLQIVGMLNECLDELVVKYKWPYLNRDAAFVTVAAEDQGLLETIAPGFKAIIPKTFWNRSASLPAEGSITPSDVQVLRIWGARTAVPTYRTVQGKLQIIPAPAAGQNMEFQYVTQYPVLANDNITLKQYFTADTDTVILPDNLLVLMLRYKWRMEKGLSYAENMNTFEIICKQAFVDSLGQRDLSLKTTSTRAMPGIIIPPGNWNQ